MDNFDYLSEVFNDYCIKHKLPLDMSADDMIHEIYNLQENIIFKCNTVNYDRYKKNLEWLDRFRKIWEELT